MKRFSWTKSGMVQDDHGMWTDADAAREHLALPVSDGDVRIPTVYEWRRAHAAEAVLDKIQWMSDFHRTNNENFGKETREIIRALLSTPTVGTEAK